MSEDSWVFDSLVCFLHGPIWQAPLQTFIEEKSLIFDPNVDNDIENSEYVKIHNEYKNLVDFMLGSFMDEMQISPEKFELACLEGKNLNILPKDEINADGSTFSFHKGLFQQIWAANDIRIFIRMMIQRNVEIQLQALDLIERRQASLNKEDDKISEETINDLDEQVEEIVTKEIANAVENEIQSDIIPEVSENDDPIEDANDKFKRLNLFFQQDKIDSADITARQEYLRAQRDKILNIKKKARVHQLNESLKKNERPSSAQFAQKIMDGDTEDVIKDSPSSSEALQLRQALARRLRKDVVDSVDS